VNGVLSSLTRLTFTAPDGTEYELRDTQTEGKPFGASGGDPCQQNTVPTTNGSRGTAFAARDGSEVVFNSASPIVDTTSASATTAPAGPSGVLLFPNGSLYQISQGLVSYIRDRNGNEITFTYDAPQYPPTARVTQINDSLGRVVTIAYGGPIQATPPYHDTIQFTGYGQAARQIVVTWGLLGQQLQSGTLQTFPQLFPEFIYENGNTFNQTVPASVTLPNNLQYQFFYNPYGELTKVTLPTGGMYQYVWGSGYTNSTQQDGAQLGTDAVDYNIYRRVLSRSVYTTGTTLQGTDTYSAAATAGPNPYYGGAGQH
jgi:hypothetical protein